MHKIWLALLVCAVLLAGCGGVIQQSSASAPPTTQPTAPKPVWLEPTPSLSTATADVPRSSVDNMPLLGDANLQTYTDEAGILRSPIDNMPLLPGDPNVAPMPDGLFRK